MGLRLGRARLRADDPDPLARNLCQVCEVDGVVAVRGVDHDGGAGLGVGEGVVVLEVLEARSHGSHRQAVRVEVVGAARDLQAAQVGEVGALDEARRTRGPYDSHVESSVVGNEHVSRGEADEVGKLFAPERRVHDIRRHDPVDAGVPLAERVVAERRMDEPACRVDDLPVTHLDHADRAGRGAVGVGGFEVDGGEVESHARIVSRPSDGRSRHAPRGRIGA